MQSQSNPFKRHKTRHRGITFRVKADGSRAYYVYAGGRQLAVPGGEKAALAKQAELRGKLARGESAVPARKTFAEAAEAWYALKEPRLRYKTKERYETALGLNGRGKERAELRLIPRFGHLKLADLTADGIALWIRDLEAAGLSGSSVSNHLKPLNGTMAYAVRKGWIPQNPVALLTSDERPSTSTRELRILGYEQVEKFFSAAKRLAARPTARYDYEPLFRTAVFTGLRLGELLGLLWKDVELGDGAIMVRAQLSQRGTREAPKTKHSLRRVVLAPDLVQFLREYRLRSRFSKETDYVFPSRTGGPLSHRNVEARGFDKTIAEAGLVFTPKLVLHDLRHVYASMMIERGITSMELADQMGHSNSGVTERRYVHLFNRQRTEEKLRAALQSAWQVGKPLASTDGNGREPNPRAEASKTASLRVFGADRN